MAKIKMLVIEASGGDDTSAIAGAMSSLNAAGGGEIWLNSETYNISSAITLMSGVKVRGAGYMLSSGSTIVGGTVMQGNGTSDCFIHNSTDSETGPADSAAMYAEALFGSGVSGMAFTGFINAIKVGSKNNTGCFHSVFEELFATQCSGWGFYFDNCSLSQFTMLTVKNLVAGAVGGMKFAGSMAVWNHGNCSYRHLFAEPDKDLTRGIVFQAYNAATFNDNNIYHIQCNTGGEFHSSASTSNGTTTIALNAGDGQYFPVDMPVSVTSTALGLTTLQTYFVVANDGSDNIQIAHEQGDTAGALTVSAGSPTIVTHGFPGIEVCGYGPTSGVHGTMQPTVMSGIDIEGSQSCGLLWQNAALNADINIVPSDQGVTSGDVCFSSIVFRGDAIGTYRSLSTFVAVDIQNHYKGLYNLGTKVNFNTYPNSIVQSAPIGFYYDGGNSQSYLTFAGNLMGQTYSMKSMTALSGSFIYPNQTLGQRCLARSNDNDYTLSHFNAGASVWTATTATARTWTLPVLNDGAAGTSTSVGIIYEICNGNTNAGAPTLTLACNTGDYFNNDSTKTSIVLSQFDTVTVRAQYNGSVAFWQVLSYVDHSTLP